MKRIGFIGAYGGQADRILKSDKIRNCELLVYEHDSHKHRPVIEGVDYLITLQLADLLLCDAIIICSPTNTHFGYLKYLKDMMFKGFVFCEKPPANNQNEFLKLRNFPDSFKAHTLFDLNLRRSYLQNILSNPDDITLGKIKYVGITCGHGLAYKPTYANSWRNNPDNMILGVFETVGIHYIDFALRNFGKPLKSIYSESISSPFSHVPDNSFLSMIFKDGINVNIFISYTTPLIDEIQVICENAIVKVLNGNIIILGPRDTFDENGYFDYPPLIKEIRFENGFWEDSIENTLAYFRVNHFFYVMSQPLTRRRSTLTVA